MRTESKEFRIKADQQAKNAQMFQKRANRFYDESKFNSCQKSMDSGNQAIKDMNYYNKLADAALEIERQEKFGN
jgi:hypothetical protein